MKYLFSTSYALNLDYKPCFFRGINAVFIGQMDNGSRPHGIVRIIDERKGVYDGQINAHGELHGWGRWITNDGESIIGWWRKNILHGNAIKI